MSDNLPTAATPMDMVQAAVTSGASVDTLERLLSLQERWQAQQARVAFATALSELRGELPPIIKTETVDFRSGAGRTTYRHEDLAAITKALSPVMAKHGLSFRWRTFSEQGSVTVTCVVAHKDGHQEETSLAGPLDHSGNKNAIQAIGSAVTYLQRYTLKAALGVAAAQDDDATSVASPEPKSVQTEQDFYKDVAAATKPKATREQMLEPFNKLWEEYKDVLTLEDFKTLEKDLKGKGKRQREGVLATWQATAKRRREAKDAPATDASSSERGVITEPDELMNHAPEPNNTMSTGQAEKADGELDIF